MMRGGNTINRYGVKGTFGNSNAKASVQINRNGIGIINVSRAILYANNGKMEEVIQSAINYTNKIRNIIWNPVNC